MMEEGVHFQSKSNLSDFMPASVELTRPLQLSRDIIFLDGMNGTGKSILGPILGAFKRIEKQSLNHVFEHVCLLAYFKKIEPDAAVSFLRIYADLALYNSMISREVNLRPADDSGILNNPRSLAYLSRLFQPDGDAVVARIESENPILHIMTHQFFPMIDTALAAFGARMKVIEMVRHPLYMIEHWISYIDRYGTDPREFNFWIAYKGMSLPWFAHGWEQQYLESNPYDRSIYAIERLYRMLFRIIKDPACADRILTVTFEDLVMNPDSNIEAIAKFLGTGPTDSLGRIMKRQKCPRSRISDGRGHKRYGFRRESIALTERDIQVAKLEKIRQLSSKDGFAAFLTLANDYAANFPQTRKYFLEELN